MNDLKIQSKTEEKRVIVYISGDIDAYHSPKLKEEMDTFVNGELSDIALDLSDVPYIDSAGLGTLVSILRETRNAKKALKLVGLRQNIKRIFEMTRLDKIFDVYDTLEESAVGNKRVGGSY
ncbi:MAG TPA: STAS domain-containing protein [Thermotogota bacterium]|jgi:anti-sigma B factor antagonist|nr:STAS domain-containing protein [Thermotogota bacterium]NLH20433.1 STAS domain-containing protein [Thermotogaceae bacterium]OQC32805.1 MAG: putative anti-sigma factor antagonist [Thermotogota bacterium ADurb.Bin062]HNW46901.1 STAS domain-containing protein [Thermotogota bacterium]HNY82750.1 STAS domain-containing protein [Thermotogota bacterium]